MMCQQIATEAEVVLGATAEFAEHVDSGWWTHLIFLAPEVVSQVAEVVCRLIIETESFGTFADKRLALPAHCVRPAIAFGRKAVSVQFVPAIIIEIIIFRLS